MGCGMCLMLWEECCGNVRLSGGRVMVVDPSMSETSTVSVIPDSQRDSQRVRLEGRLNWRCAVLV